ncbi:putative albumin I chain a [Medicago truncatula]|uniref:Albumin I n=1 Tax=Medicago truncatula TaxID=3880 RepID=A0A072UYI6_MEDTR|nr:albumin I [Medicago truncatula]RHN68196.1 putative albumin I chain a [Medicago truncatula]
MKKIEGTGCGMPCNEVHDVCDSEDCFCYSEASFSGDGNCVTFTPFIKKVEEHPNLCQTHTECTKKGSGNFCARFPNSNRKYGFCVAANSEAKEAFKMASSSKLKNYFLKMYVPA